MVVLSARLHGGAAPAAGGGASVVEAAHARLAPRDLRTRRNALCRGLHALYDTIRCDTHNLFAFQWWGASQILRASRGSLRFIPCMNPPPPLLLGDIAAWNLCLAP